jgi:hypothetical protein
LQRNFSHFGVTQIVTFGHGHLAVARLLFYSSGGTTDYSGQFLYQDNELSCIFTPVGRIVLHNPVS